MRKRILSAVLLLIAISITLFSCKGPAGSDGSDGESDKLTQLRFGGDWSNNTTNWSMAPYETFYLIKFDKRNYVNLDSIIFSCSLKTFNTNVFAYGQLYNITDSIAIQHSEVQTKGDYVLVDSPNLLDYIPNKEIKLGVRIKSGQQGVDVATGVASYLFLYKH